LISTVIAGIIVLFIISVAVFVIIRDRITGRNGCGKGCSVCRSCNQNVKIELCFLIPVHLGADSDRRVYERR